MYLSIDKIKKIQLDHTSRCNCSCPQCARMASPTELNPRMPVVDLSLDDYKILLSPFDTAQLLDLTLFHCGNFGDALASPTFDETFDYCLSKGVGKIIIATNGSIRSPQWWSALAKKARNKLIVIFSVDGLEDTNHLYRVGANFNKIIENAKAFIAAGGRARWAFIEFEHNYHQISQAHALSKELGFEKFQVKYTARFAEQNNDKIETKKGNIVKDRQHNHNVQDKVSIINKYGSFNEYVKNTLIRCKFQAEQAMFVDMEMKLWPCCWFGAPQYLSNDNPQKKDFEYLNTKFGPDFNDLRKHGWKVLTHEFFNSHLETTWNSPSATAPRIYTCGRTCGQQFEYSSGYGKNSQEINNG